MFPRDRALPFAVTAILALPLTGLAHDLRLFTAIEETAIVGRVYFEGGRPASGTVVELLGPNREYMSAMTVNGDGRFRFPLEYRSDYLVQARTPDLHQAESVVDGAELPAELPTLSAGPRVRERIDESLDKEFQREVRSEFRLVREQIDQLESTIRLRDIMGGIGYIVGILGLILFFRQRKSA